MAACAGRRESNEPMNMPRNAKANDEAPATAGGIEPALGNSRWKRINPSSANERVTGGLAANALALTTSRLTTKNVMGPIAPRIKAA